MLRLFGRSSCFSPSTAGQQLKPPPPMHKAHLHSTSSRSHSSFTPSPNSAPPPSPSPCICRRYISDKFKRYTRGFITRHRRAINSTLALLASTQHPAPTLDISNITTTSRKEVLQIQAACRTRLAGPACRLRAATASVGLQAVPCLHSNRAVRQARRRRNKTSIRL